MVFRCSNLFGPMNSASCNLDAKLGLSAYSQSIASLDTRGLREEGPFFSSQLDFAMFSPSSNVENWPISPSMACAYVKKKTHQNMQAPAI